MRSPILNLLLLLQIEERVNAETLPEKRVNNGLVKLPRFSVLCSLLLQLFQLEERMMKLLFNLLLLLQSEKWVNTEVQ